jgi:hypothetical protein
MKEEEKENVNRQSAKCLMLPVGHGQQSVDEARDRPNMLNKEPEYSQHSNW